MVKRHKINNECPYCGRQNQLHAEAGGSDIAPHEGAVSICFQCNQPAMFNADLTLRKPTPEELDEIADDLRKYLAMRAEVYTPTQLLDLLSRSGWQTEH